MCRVCRRCCRAHLPFASPRNRCRGVRTCWSPKVRLSCNVQARARADNVNDRDSLFARNEIDETWSSRLTVLRIPRGDPFGNPLEELTAAHVSWSTCVTKTISSDADRGYTALASGARVLRRVGTMWRLAATRTRTRPARRARSQVGPRSPLCAHGHSTLTGVRLDIIIRQSTGPQALSSHRKPQHVRAATSEKSLIRIHSRVLTTAPQASLKGAAAPKLLHVNHV